MCVATEPSRYNTYGPLSNDADNAEQQLLCGGLITPYTHGVTPGDEK